MNWARQSTLAVACSLRKRPQHTTNAATIDAFNSSLQTVQTYTQSAIKVLQNPASLGARVAKTAESGAETAINNPESLLTRLRNLDTAAMTSVAIIGAETIGFFSVGEMIGRFKIIGYRGGHSAHH